MEWKAFLQNMRCSKNCIHLRRFSQYLHPAVRPASLHKLSTVFPKQKSTMLILQRLFYEKLGINPNERRGKIDENRNDKKGVREDPYADTSNMLISRPAYQLHAPPW